MDNNWYFNSISELYNRHGFHKQASMLVEECAELIDVMMKMRRNRRNDNDLLSELADVRIMVDQIALKFDNDEYTRMIVKKLKRALNA